MNKIIALAFATVVTASTVAFAAPAVFPSTSETAQSKDNGGQSREGVSRENNDRQQ